jgi:hypothetical protein
MRNIDRGWKSFDREGRARFIAVNPQIQRDGVIWQCGHSLEAGEVGQSGLAQFFKLCRACRTGGSVGGAQSGTRLDFLCCLFCAPSPTLRRDKFPKGSLFGAALPILQERYRKMCGILIDQLCAVLAKPDAVVFSSPSLSVGIFIVSRTAGRRCSNVRTHADIDDAIVLGIRANGQPLAIRV